MCDKRHTKLTMHFTINLTFTNYLDLMPNLMEHLTLNRDKTSYEQPLLVYLNISCFDNSLSKRPGKLKDFIHNYIQSASDKEIFELKKKGHATHTLSPYSNFFFNKIVNNLTFTSSIISMITITLVIYLYCKHKHIRTIIIASLILHKAKEVEAKTFTEIDNSECELWHT